MPPSWNTLEYRLHARVGILHGVRPAVRLWYALRALDVEGTGKVVIPAGEIERQLGKSRTTIWRYLQDRVFFRSYRYGGGLLTVYLHGLRAVCLSLGIDSIGPVGFNMGLTTIQKDSAAIGAQSLQQSSLYLARLAAHKDKKVISVLDATLIQQPSHITEGATAVLGLMHDTWDTFLPAKGTSLCAGSIPVKTVSGSHTLVHLLECSATLYGASLEGIATMLGVCSKTISRSLRGVARIRQAQRVPYWEYKYWQHEASENLGRSVSPGFYGYNKDYGAYKLYTYLYYPNYCLCSQRVLKSHVNPALKGGGCVAGCNPRL